MHQVYAKTLLVTHALYIGFYAIHDFDSLCFHLNTSRIDTAFILETGALVLISVRNINETGDFPLNGTADQCLISQLDLQPLSKAMLS